MSSRGERETTITTLAQLQEVGGALKFGDLATLPDLVREGLECLFFCTEGKARSPHAAQLFAHRGIPSAYLVDGLYIFSLLNPDQRGTMAGLIGLVPNRFAILYSDEAQLYHSHIDLLGVKVVEDFSKALEIMMGKKGRSV